jgi:hypothetical protein
MHPNTLDKKPHSPEWQQVIAAQNAAYPCCKHGTHTPFILDDQPFCWECYQKDSALAARLKSMQLVSGGLT